MAFIGATNPALVTALMQNQPQQPISTGPTRSQLVNQFLQQQAAQRPQQIQSYGEGFARLGSDLVQALMAKEGISDQLQQQEAMTRQQQARKNLLAQSLGVPAGLDEQSMFGVAEFEFRRDQAQKNKEAAAAARIAKQQAEQEKLAKEQQTAEEKASKLRFENVQGLRKEAAALTKDFRQQKAAIQRIRDVSFNEDGSIKQTPGSGLALIFNFMKVLDPNSVVRESEFATAEKARAAVTRLEEDGLPVPSAVKQALQSISGEGRLLPEQIQDFNDQAEAIIKGARQTALDDISPVLASARANGYELDRIFSQSLLDDLNSPAEPVAEKQASGKRFVYNPETGRLEPK